MRTTRKIKTSCFEKSLLFVYLICENLLVTAAPLAAFPAAPTNILGIMMIIRETTEMIRLLLYLPLTLRNSVSNSITYCCTAAGLRDPLSAATYNILAAGDGEPLFPWFANIPFATSTIHSHDHIIPVCSYAVLDLSNMTYSMYKSFPLRSHMTVPPNTSRCRRMNLRIP
jgi:hypothetical protein